MNKKTYSGVAKGRSFWLIDVENIIGSGSITEQQVIEARANLYSLRKPKGMDQVYVASNSFNKVATAFGWPDGARGFTHGQDGADYLLIKQMIPLIKDGGFDHVFLASGDADLAEYVKVLMDAGIAVTVFARHQGFSYAMAHSGAEVIWLDSHYQLAA